MITFWAAIMVLAFSGLVFWPLLKGIGGGNRLRLVEDIELRELLAQKDATLLAISELEADYGMGNLSLEDYQELRKRYEEKASAIIKTADEMRRERGLEVASNADDEIEAKVSALRHARRTAETDVEDGVSKLRAAKHAPKATAATSCPGCGAALQAEARFCSHCGAVLSVKCPNCSQELAVNDKFCFHCGASLKQEKA